MKPLQAIFSRICLGLLLIGICTSRDSNKEKKPERPLTPTKIYRDGESSVFVYDGVFGKRLLSVTAEMVKRHATWYFTHPDHYEGVGAKDNGDLHWNAPFSPESFSRSLIWKGLQRGLKGAGIFDGVRLFPYDVQGVMLLRGFSPIVYKGNGEGDVFIRIFVTNGVKKNDYSELLVYNKNEEIFAPVFPKYGRVVIWNDTADFIFRPPSMNVEQAEYSLLIKATQDESKYKEYLEKYKEAEKSHMEMKSIPFPFTNASYEDIYNIDLAKHLTWNFTDSSGRIVAVFDNVLAKEEVDAVRSHFLNSNSAYSYDGYDKEYGETNDNVNWIVKKDPMDIINSRIWKVVHHCASFLSGENQWFPYDVAMNIIQHTHHTRIHTDCSPHEHEYTFLMYLSPEWKEERYGETIFLEEANGGNAKMMPGNEKYETLGAVIPKYGRIVVFRNIIEHSARPPSPDFLAARYTFAVKVGRSPEISIAKALREVLDIYESNPKAKKLQDDIFAGKYDVYNDKKKEAFLRKSLAKYQEMVLNGKNSDKRKTLQMLKLPADFS